MTTLWIIILYGYSLHEYYFCMISKSNIRNPLSSQPISIQWPDKKVPSNNSNSSKLPTALWNVNLIIISKNYQLFEKENGRLPCIRLRPARCIDWDGSTKLTFSIDCGQTSRNALQHFIQIVRKLRYKEITMNQHSSQYAGNHIGR